MTNRAIDLVSPRFVKARTLPSLEKKMKVLILTNRKQYDFYFFQEVDGGFIAWYREELSMDLSGLKPTDLDERIEN